MSRRALAPLALVAALALGVGALALGPAFADEPRPSGPVADPALALEGGTRPPDGAWKIPFPWVMKQAVSFVSDALVERTVGAVNFSDVGTKPLGTVSLDGKGGGSGAFAVTVADISTLSPERDARLRSDEWLDAKRFPEIAYTIAKVERVRPTVYRVTGTWKMHGVEKELTTLANVRFVERLDGFEGKDGFDAKFGLARLKARFSVGLKAFGVDNAYVGTPLVADAWDVEMVLLGALAKP